MNRFRLGLAILFGAIFWTPFALATDICVFEMSACPKDCPAKTRLESFGRWLGRPVDRVSDYVGGQTWQDLIQHAFNKAQYWRKAVPGTKLLLAVQMLPAGDENANLEKGAAGEYDSQFRTLAKTLVRAGAGRAELRLGWEFNGDWYRWRASANPTAFVAYWRRIVHAMRAVPGANFTFNWNPALGGHAIAADSAYPGDEFVDVIGIDFYNHRSSVLSPARRWDLYLNQPNGLRWLADFAAKHHKPLAIPEWGTGSKSGTEFGGGNDPFFVHHAADWFRTNHVVYACYFDFNKTDGFDNKITDGSKPATARAFIQEFGTADSRRQPSP